MLLHPVKDCGFVREYCQTFCNVNMLVLRGNFKKSTCCLATKSCLTLCDPMDYTVHGILQARILVPSLGDLSDPGIEPRSPALQADSLLSGPPGRPM